MLACSLNLNCFLNIHSGVKVRQICHIALKRDHEYVNTVEEGSEETHAKVGHAVILVICYYYIWVSFLTYYITYNHICLRSCKPI